MDPRLDKIRAAAAAIPEAEAVLAEAVKEARKGRPVSWREIGAALGVSTNAVYKKYGPEPDLRRTYKRRA